MFFWADWLPDNSDVSIIKYIEKSGVFALGVSYKYESIEKSKEKLRENGLTGILKSNIKFAADAHGEFGGILGVYGAPEAFVIDSKGYVVKRWVGEVTGSNWREEVEPVLHSMREN